MIQKEAGICYESSTVGGRSNVLYGQRFGHLIVITLAEYRNDKNYWLCNCDCGHQIVVSQPDLKKGKVTSCERCIRASKTPKR